MALQNVSSPSAVPPSSSTPQLDRRASSPPVIRWKLRKELLDRLQREPADPGQWYKKCILLSSDPESDFVIRLFHESKPYGFGIARIYAIYNSAHTTSFESELANMEQEAKRFLPRWEEAALKVERAKTTIRWYGFTEPYSPVEITHNGEVLQLKSAKALPLWHGSSREKCDSICGSGFTYFGKHNLLTQGSRIESTDIGFYGSGIYFTNSARYASMYARGALLLSWVSAREPYPVVSDVPHPKKCADMALLEGKGAYENYNAHYIPVASTNPDNPKWMNYYPCYQNQVPAWDEVVVFQKAQTLPAYLIELAVDTPSSLAMEYSFAACSAVCQAGALDQLKAWYSDGPNRIQDRGDQGETYLFAAVRGNQVHILEWFFQKDPSLIEVLREDGSSLLHVAAIEGHHKTAKWLCTKKRELLNQPNQAKFTPIQVAAFADKLGAFRFFLDEIKKYPTLIFDLAKRPCTASLAFLIENGFDFHVTNSFKQSLLHLAAEAGQEENVRYLMARGLKIDDTDRSGRNPLFMAVLQGHRSVARFILQSNALLNAISLEGETVVHVAAFYGHTPILDDILYMAEELKMLKRLLRMQDHDGKTALHKAVWGKPKPDVVQLLLDKGDDPNCKNNFFYTPLHWAAKHGHLESAKLLLTKGARLDIYNDNGDFPLNLAIRYGQDELVHLFLGTSRKLVQIGPLPQDVEGYFFKSLLEAKKSGFVEDQLFCLEKLSDHFVQNKNFLQGAKILNSALAIVQEQKNLPAYESYLFARLERIEGFFLGSKGIKVPSDMRNYIFDDRVHLKEARLSCKKNLAAVSIGKVLDDMAKSHQALLKFLIEKALQWLGPPPTQWAAIGMGAMASGEMVPFSSLKFAFLIEKSSDEALSFFRTLTEFLELKIANLGETDFPIFGSDQPSPTPDGFSIERGFSPLGIPEQYELIGTPSQLAQFQSLESIKHSFGLVKAMRTHCLVAGDETLYGKYKKIKDNGEKLALAILAQYFSKFSPAFSPVKDKPFNLYQALYRPFEELFDGLAYFFHLKEMSTFARIDALEKEGIFSSAGAENLRKAFAQLQTLRLEAHLFYADRIELLYHHTQVTTPQLLYFSDASYNSVQEIYKVLLPFHAAVKDFLETKKKSSLKHNSFYNEKL